MSLVSLIAIDIDLWSLSYEWNPSNFTKDLGKINATLLSGNHNQVLAEIGGNPNDESVGFVTHAIEEVGLEGYHTMAPAESGASVVGRSMWAFSTACDHGRGARHGVKRHRLDERGRHTRHIK